jgi:hypothetical protein
MISVRFEQPDGLLCAQELIGRSTPSTTRPADDHAESMSFRMRNVPPTVGAMTTCCLAARSSVRHGEREVAARHESPVRSMPAPHHAGRRRVTAKCDRGRCHDHASRQKPDPSQSHLLFPAASRQAVCARRSPAEMAPDTAACSGRGG